MLTGSRTNLDCTTNMCERFTKTYSDANYDHMWEATFEMLNLFGEAARGVAKQLLFTYDENEEKGIEII